MEQGTSDKEPRGLKKSVLDKDLGKIVLLEKAIEETATPRTRALGLGFLFLVAVWAFTTLISGGLENSSFIIVGGVIGGYMALNIGANDVANNVGPAVGSRALTMLGALAIAAVFETAGAIIAGGDVVATISKGIIDPSLMPDIDTFILVMMSAMLAAALWINIATMIGAPVSTTHAIVGGVIGSGIAAVGVNVVDWVTMGKIAASWVVSPVLGGVFAAVFLAFIKVNVIRKEDKVAAARKWVPLLIAIMAAAFAMYLSMKGLKKVVSVPPWMVLTIGATVFALTWRLMRPFIARRSQNLENRRKAVSSLFTVPLICSAALLSFAHGANDVANAVGPLAGIVSAVSANDIAAKVAIPGWVMLVGALGISTGLILFGPKLIRTVGEKITKLDQIRAFCVALSAAITVIAASALGLPVSSTHIAVGGVFGVGFLREFIANRNWPSLAPAPAPATYANPVNPGNPTLTTKDLTPEKQEKKIRKAEKRKLVRRRHLLTIIAAWLITVPAAALLSSAIFFLLHVTP